MNAKTPPPAGGRRRGDDDDTIVVRLAAQLELLSELPAKCNNTASRRPIKARGDARRR
jgi:hypothetical protein